jgi:hypothetical protein
MPEPRESAPPRRSTDRRAVAYECPECGICPPDDIHGQPYDCNGQPYYPRHDWARPVRRTTICALTLPGHDEQVGVRIEMLWRKASR